MAKAPQNPQSRVAPGVSAGAATVLPSPGFNPQQFFADMIGEKKAEAQLELQRRRQVEQSNLAYFDKISQYDKDYWDRDAAKIEGMANEILSEIVDETMAATAKGELIGFSQRAKHRNDITRLRQAVAESKQTRQEVAAIMREAKGTKDIAYDPTGLQQMMEDIENGNFSFEKRHTDYLLPRKNWKFIGAPGAISSIAKLFSTETVDIGGRRVQRINPNSIDEARNIAMMPNSDLMQYVNYEAEEGMITDTEEARKERAKQLFNAAISSVNTRNTRASSGAFPGGPRNTDLAHGNWHIGPIGVSGANEWDEEIKYGTVADVTITDNFPVAAQINQERFRPERVVFLPVAVKGMGSSGNRVEAGDVIPLDFWRGYTTISDNTIENIRFEPFVSGAETNGKKVLIPFDDSVHRAMKSGSRGRWKDVDEQNMRKVWNELASEREKEHHLIDMFDHHNINVNYRSTPGARQQSVRPQGPQPQQQQQQQTGYGAALNEL